jgi:hypothetical protein
LGRLLVNHERAGVMNLIEGIQAECNRVRDILPHYEMLGRVGQFGAVMLRAAIVEGEAAIASGDVVRMLRALDGLKGCK